MAKDNAPSHGVYTRQNFLSIYIPAITLSIGTGIVVPALPVYARSFGIPFEVASLVLVAQQVGTTLSSFPTGLLMDRIGRRKIMLAGPVVLAISSFLMVIAQSFPELLAYRFIAGMGQQMWLLGRLTMIADTGADRERGRQITTMSAMESSGRLLSPAIGGFLAAFWDVRAPFVVHAVLCLVAIIPSFILVRETAPHMAAGAVRAVKTAGDAGWGALLTFTVLIFFLAQFMASLTRGPIFSGQINLYGAYIYDLGPQTIGLLATAVTAVGIPISLASGYIMDKYGRKATLVPGFILLTVALTCMAVTAYVHVPFEVFIAAYLGVFASNSITGGNMQTLGSDIAPTEARGRFYGVWQTLGNVGSPVSTSVFALLSGTVSYWVAFGSLALMAALAAFILATLVHDRLRDKPAPAAAAAS